MPRGRKNAAFSQITAVTLFFKNLSSHSVLSINDIQLSAVSSKHNPTMPDPTPKIITFQPVVLPDNHRVTLELEVSNLPGSMFNIMFMPDLADAPPGPPADQPGSYPDVELSILDSRRRQVAALLIVEHREPRTALTLHLRAPNPQEQYIARVEMTLNNEAIDTVEASFTLHQPA
jgi:hypothetical protein